MITGTFSITDNTRSVPGMVNGATAHAGLCFVPVTCPGFSGGYFTGGQSPLTTDDIFYEDTVHDIVVLLSGTVYNREDLYRMGGGGTGMPDPALIAGLFTRYGPGFVSNLNGDFAICIIRPQKGRMYLFRDHIGIRPLAYSEKSDSLIFSTDITGLCKYISGGKDINRTFLTGHFRYIDYRVTPADKVKKLLPGHYLEYSSAGLRTVRYWKPETIATEKSMAYGRMIEEMGEIVRDAVRIRCDSRFTAAAHVSGGLDSGLVSVLARREYKDQREFFGFSWSPAAGSPVKGRQDERDMVKKTCEPVGIIPVFSDMGPHYFTEAVASYYENHGYFSEYDTARQAAARGINLIFSGWGGDEFISTGAAAMEPDLIRSLHWRLYLQRNSIIRPKLFLYNFTRYVLYPALGILDRNTARSFRDDARYMKKGYRKSDRSALRKFYFNTSRRSHHLGMLEFYHLQERCESWYEMGFRMGIEYRYPLLDRRIIEYMFRVPSELLCRTGQSRPILRELGKEILDEEVRLSNNKSDPVYWSYMRELYRESSAVYMEELSSWRGNPDMGFVDFELLEHDISGYRAGADTVGGELLFRALVYLKAMHEFTLSYHGKSGV